MNRIMWVLIWFREFMVAMDITCEGTVEEKLAWAFKVYDVDGDGVIKYHELKR